MSSTRSKSLRQGFLLDEQELRRLYDMILEQIGEAGENEGVDSSFELTFRDDVTSKFDSIDDVLALDNGGNAAIRWLILRVRKWRRRNYRVDTVRTIAITFRDASTAGGLASIDYYLEGESRDWVFVTGSMLEERFDRIRIGAPHPFYNSLRGVMGQSLTFVLVVMVTGPVVELVWPSPPDRFRPIGLLVALSAGGASLFIPAVLSVMYPAYNFYWGYRMRELDRRWKVSNIIASVLGASILLAIGVGLLSNYLRDRISG